MILDFAGKILGVVAKAAGIGSVSDAVDTVQGAISGNAELQTQLKQLELEQQRLVFDDVKNLRDLYGQELQSEDKVVKWVRPACVWIVVAILGMAFVLVPFTNIWIGIFGGKLLEVTFPELPDSVLALFGTLFALYGGYRSYDKKTKNGGK